MVDFGNYKLRIKGWKNARVFRSAGAGEGPGGETTFRGFQIADLRFQIENIRRWGQNGNPKEEPMLPQVRSDATARACATIEFFKSTAREDAMATLGLIEYNDASPEVRAVYDDIMATRQTDWINNFWKALAHDPATLRRTWQSIKQIMAEGALDRLTKELIYVAVSVTNQCNYCIASHTAGARKAGMTDAMLAELFAVVGMANETNSLASAWQVEVDEQFKTY